MFCLLLALNYSWIITSFLHLYTHSRKSLSQTFHFVYSAVQWRELWWFPFVPKQTFIHEYLYVTHKR